MLHQICRCVPVKRNARSMSGMTVEEFQKRGKQLVDYMCEYMDTVACRRVAPDVEYGYLRKCLPPQAPKCRESFDVMLKDVEEKIMPGVLHWNHPKFFGYFPSGNSYSSLLAEMFCDHSAALSLGGWHMNPAGEEIEEIVLDWFAKAMGLPNYFLHECGDGGGIMIGTAGESIFNCMLTARHHCIKALKGGQEDLHDNIFLPKLVTYFSKEAHSSMAKAAIMSMVKYRSLDTDDICCLRGCTLEKAMEEDMKKGLVPFFVVGNLGTTSLVAFDKIKEMGEVCRRHNVWFHVDATLAGNFFLCPELRYLMEGIELSDSVNVNAYKGLLTHIDSGCLFVKDKKKHIAALQIKAPFIKYGEDSNDLRLHMSHRFRALKLWYVMRSYGIEGLQLILRKTCCFANVFKALMKQDKRFEIINHALGLVAFQVKCDDDNELTEKLWNCINQEREIHLTPTRVKGKFIIRLYIDYADTTEDDILAVDYASIPLSFQNHVPCHLASLTDVNIPHNKMTVEEFQKRGKQLVDYMCEYMDTVACRRVAPDVEYGYLRKCLPPQAPKCRESFDVMLKDVEEKIMPGVLHWNHPKFFGYFPSGNSYSSLLAEMFCDHSAALSLGGWHMNPAGEEIEEIVLDWFAKAMGLPNYFLHECGDGGGVMIGTAGESIFNCMLTARHHCIKALKGGQEDLHDNMFLPKLVAYFSKEAHSSMEKAAIMSMVKYRSLDTDDNCCLRGCTLEKAMEEDMKKGLVPFFVVGNLGTTSLVAFDKIKEMGEVCRRHNVWFHVDGALGGNFFLCPEHRYLMEGIELCDSVNVNPYKGVLAHIDSGCLFVKDKKKHIAALHIKAPFIKYGEDSNDLRLHMSHRFRALKLWYVMRSYGIEGLQLIARKTCCFANVFKALMKEDKRFEIINHALGLVAFRVKCDDDNELTEKLWNCIHQEREIHLTPTRVKGKFIIRLYIDYADTTEDDIHFAWNVIKRHADSIVGCSQ